MSRRDFRTPTSIPVASTGRCIVVPDDAQWLGLLNAALLMLTEQWRYDQVESTDLTPEEVSAVWYEIYEQTLSSECGAVVGLLDVRQSTLAPCILEKQLEDGGWLAFADLSLCASPLAQTTYNPATGELEYEGGASARNIDPRFVGTKSELSVATDCDDAKYIIGYMQLMLDDLLTEIDLGANIATLTAALVSALAIIFSFGAAAPIAAAFGAAIVGLTRVTIEAAMTTAVWERLLCAVYCHTQGATNITDNMYDAIVADNTETGLAYTIVNHLLWQLGPVGLQNAIPMQVAPSAAIAAYDCDACVCGGWTKAWLGGDGWSDWIIGPWDIGGTITCTASYDSVNDRVVGCQGSKDWGAGLWRIGASTYVTFPQRHITSYRVSWNGNGNATNTIYKMLTRLYKGGVLQHERFDYTRVRDITINVSVDADRMTINQRDATSVSTARTHLLKVELSGNGTNPF